MSRLAPAATDETTDVDTPTEVMHSVSPSGSALSLALIASLGIIVGLVPIPVPWVRTINVAQGQRHKYHAVLCLAVLGWFAGQRSYRGIGRWVQPLPQSVLQREGCTRDGWWRAPGTETIRRHLHATDPEALHEAVSYWLEEE